MNTTQPMKRFNGPYRLTFEVEMSFQGHWHVGSGDSLSAISDNPLLRDEKGEPLLPGSSIRGVLRDFCEREACLYQLPDDVILTLFGPSSEELKEPTKDRKGRLTFFDAHSKPTPSSTEVLDFNRHETAWGAVADGGKFDAEVARSTSIYWKLRYDGNSKDDPEVFLLCQVFRLLKQDGILTFGARGSAGFGMPKSATITAEDVDRATQEGFKTWIQSRLPEGIAKQLGLEPQAESASAKKPSLDEFMKDLKKPETNPSTTRQNEPRFQPWCWLCLDLKWEFEGPMFVEGPHHGQTGLASKDNEKKYITLANGTPYLPATSLRGTMRARAKRIAKSLDIGDTADILFGGKQEDKVASYRGLISIGEGKYLFRLDAQRNLIPAREIFMHHVAIDRVTSFAAVQKLYSVVALASPRFLNRIILRWHDSDVTSTASAALFLITLIDIAERGLRIGGSTTRGYGNMKRLSVLGYSCSIIEKVDEESQIRERVRSSSEPGKVISPRELSKVVPKMLFDAWRNQVKSAKTRAEVMEENRHAQ